jgi:hypothetical protein
MDKSLVNPVQSVEAFETEALDEIAKLRELIGDEKASDSIALELIQQQSFTD